MNKKTWLGPVTEDHIAGLAKEGKKSIAVICPGFVTDNLETLEEINIRGRNIFLKNGGTDFTYIPALNNSQHWVKALSRIIHNEIKAN
jgi:ferrochelatase